MQLRQQLDVQKPFVRDQVLLSLLKGEPRDEDHWQKLLESQDLALGGSASCVMLVSLGDMPADHGLQVRETVQQMLSFLPLPLGIGYGVELMHQKLVKASLTNGHLDHLWQNDCAQCMLLKLREFQLNPFIPLGKAYMDIALLNRSYIEAVTAMEYKMLSKGESVLLFEGIGQFSKHDTWYPIEEQMKFV